MIARLFFILAPAVVVGLLASLITGSFLGLILGLAVLGLGADVARPRPERGER